MRGALEAVASCYSVPVLDAEVDAIRKHFCGVVSAVPRGRKPPGLSAREDAKRKQANRQATKDMVIQRAILLGYLPRGSDDADRADACAVWDYMAATEFRRRPTLTLT